MPTVVVVGPAAKAIKRSRFTTLKMSASPPGCGKKGSLMRSPHPRTELHVSVSLFVHRFRRENRRHFITRCLQDPATNYVPLRRRHIDKPESSVFPLIYDTTEEAASLTYAWAESGVGGYDELGTAFEVTTGTDTPAVDCSNT